jgi:phospholipid transport system substrate-binding protein
MSERIRILAAVLIVAGASLLSAGSPARAADATLTDPAAQQIQSFYGVLEDAMKGGKTLGPEGRYKKLQPAIEAAFDLSGMARLSVGPAWDKMSDADRQDITMAVERNTVANYAGNFDSYSGQKFIVDPNVVDRDGDKLVKSQMTMPGGDPIAFNYRMRKTGDMWKVIDVYLEGTISQVATRRADFSATVAKGGAKALVQSLNSLSDSMLK